MKLLNIDYIPGKEIEALGLVKGTVVQTKNLGKDFMAGMKTLVGGELAGYTEMLNESDRHQAHGGRGGKTGSRCHCKHPLWLFDSDAGRCRSSGLWHGRENIVNGVWNSYGFIKKTKVQ